MEAVLDVYQRPYDARYPVVCMDEMPRQLIRETRTPVATKPGEPVRIDYEYVREGVASVWMFVEPLAGWRDVDVTARRTAIDWAKQIQKLIDAPRYAEAERITLVCDNLNTHDLASLYQAFVAAEASRIRDKLTLVFTPKHGSWLNIAECEISVLARQCLDRRIPEVATMRQEVKTWAATRNAEHCTVDWQFTTADARIKLKRLYPKF